MSLFSNPSDLFSVVTKSDRAKAEFTWIETLGYSACEAPPNSPTSRLAEDGR